MICSSALHRRIKFQKRVKLWGFLLSAAIFSLAPQAEASPFTFSAEPYPVVGGSKQAIISDIVNEGAVPISGTHSVDVAFDFPVNGEITSITVYGDDANGIVLDADNSTARLFDAYNFGLNENKLKLEVKTDITNFGTADLIFTVNGGTNTVGTAIIDTRMQGTENIAGSQKYAEDPMGGLIDLNPNNGGVTVSNSRVTGLMWSEIYGWIDLQPPGHQITMTIESNEVARLSGMAYNDQLGYIHFDQLPLEGGGTSPGVWIDANGFFHGVAWTQSKFGYLAFGDYMLLNDAYTKYHKTQTDADSVGSWAKTTWKFTGNHEPSVTLTAPNNSVESNQPEFSFHVNDQDNDLVGYLISVERQNGPTQWDVVAMYQADEATLAPNSDGTYSFLGTFDPGTYRWRMRAFDVLLAWSSYTDYNTFTIENGAPGIQLVDPTDDENTGRRPTFEFNITEPNGDEVRYQVQIAREAAFDTIIAASAFSGFISAADGINYTPSVNLPAGLLYWRVYVVDEYGLEATDWATTQETFTVVNDPGGVDLEIEVRDNNNNQIISYGSTYDSTPTVVWTADDLGDSGPTGMLTTTISLYSDAGKTTLVQEEVITHLEGTNELTFNTLTPGADPGNIYYLDVQACDEDLPPDQECTLVSEVFYVLTRDRFGNIGTISLNSYDPKRTILPGDANADNNQYVWNSMKGWIDLNPPSGGVIVEEQRVVGYAWSEYLGWIRMNCEAAEADSGYEGMTDTCASNNYGVTNVPDLINKKSILKGKALIERTGNFIYFDKDSYNEDIDPDLPNEPEDEEKPPYTKISCDDANPNEGGPPEDAYETKGHFSGWAWSADSGWISLGAQEFIEHSEGDMALLAANDVFPITEWSCGEGLNPQFINSYKLISARDTEIKYPIAQKSASSFAGELCDGDNNPITGTSITVTRVNSDRTPDVTLGEIDYELGCEASDPGKLYLTVKNLAPYSAAQTAGLYRITGMVVDDQGKIARADESNDADPAVAFAEEQILQIVSAEPYMLHAETIETNEGTTSDEDLLADGNTPRTFNIQLFDEFGNAVYAVTQYERSGQPVIKNVSYSAIFFDRVKLDQVDDDGPIKEAVDFAYSENDEDPSVNAKLEAKATFEYPTLTSNPAYIFTYTPTDPLSKLIVDMTSLAPTVADDENKLIFHGIEATVERVFDLSNTTLEVGEFETAVQQFDEEINFQPLVTGEFDDPDAFQSFGHVHDDEDDVKINLTNHHTLKSFENYEWHTLLASQNDAGDWADTKYRNIALTWDGESNPADHDYYKSAIGSDGSIAANHPFKYTRSNFKYVGNYLKAIGESFSSAAQVLGMPTLSANSTASFTVTATPVLDGAPKNQNDTEYPYIASAIALPVTGNKMVKYDLISGLKSQIAYEVLKVAVSGSIHGEDINPGVIISNADNSVEYAQVGKIYSRPDVRKIMYSNYYSLTANATPKNAGLGFVPQHSTTLLAEFDEGDEVLDAINTGGFGIQNNQVLWLEPNGEGSNQNIAVALGDALDDGGANDNMLILDANKKAITLLVRGGNLYIRDNIITAPGTTLGIIMLRSEDEQANGRQGNIFIDPSVTRIEAAMYADGSVMSAKDGVAGGTVNSLIEETEIYDGNSSGIQLLELNRQLLIKGSIVSQNIIGKSGDARIPSDDVWMNEECDLLQNGTNDCLGNTTKMAAMAKRFDFNYLRRYRLIPDGGGYSLGNSGIRPELDCNNPSPPAGCRDSLTTTDPSDITGVAKLQINPYCQEENGDLKTDAPAECIPLSSKLKADQNGDCAAGTPWCTLENHVSGVFVIDCVINTTFCDADPGNLNVVTPIKNRKMGAAIIIEYDPDLKQKTPVGMKVPALIDVGE